MTARGQSLISLGTTDLNQALSLNYHLLTSLWQLLLRVKEICSYMYLLLVWSRLRQNTSDGSGFIHPLGVEWPFFSRWSLQESSWQNGYWQPNGSEKQMEKKGCLLHAVNMYLVDKPCLNIHIHVHLDSACVHKHIQKWFPHLLTTTKIVNSFDRSLSLTCTLLCTHPPVLSTAQSHTAVNGTGGCTYETVNL